MNGRFLTDYKKRIWRTHFIVLICAVFFCGTLVFGISWMDTVYDGQIIDFVSMHIGWGFAHWLTKINKMAWMLLGVICIFAFSWVIVEHFEMKRLLNALGQVMGAFEADDKKISLGKGFGELESEINYRKLEWVRRQEREQLEAQKKADLITYLAHDIKTPLASVIGYLNLLSETVDMPEELRRKYTGITLEKAERLEELINEFFDITRFNLSTIPLELERIDLSFMLAQIADESYPLLKAGGRWARVEVEEGLFILGDANKLARVFHNILKNAVAYSYENTEISIRAAKEGKWAHIDFCNQGKMIPKQKLDMIFEKFYRLDTARSSKTGGAGLGLAIAKEIVTEHRGTISVDSNEEHTIFSILLPMDLKKEKVEREG